LWWCKNRIIAVTTEKWKTLENNKKRTIGGRTFLKIEGNNTISPINCSDLSKKKVLKRQKCFGSNKIGSSVLFRQNHTIKDSPN